jgi:hypothetical protein
MEDEDVVEIIEDNAARIVYSNMIPITTDTIVNTGTLESMGGTIRNDTWRSNINYSNFIIREPNNQIYIINNDDQINEPYEKIYYKNVEIHPFDMHLKFKKQHNQKKFEI